MRNYWKADCSRVLKRTPRIIAAVLVAVIYIGVLVFTSDETWNSVIFVTTTSSYLSFTTIVLGLFGFGALLSDDLKAKTMQVAIGSGISRPKVVFVKYLDLATIALVDGVFMGLVTALCAVLTGITLTGDQIAELGVVLFMTWLHVVAFAGPALIVALFLQATGIATIVYLLVAFGIPDLLLSELFNMKAIRGLHLTEYMLNQTLDSLQSKVILGVPAVGTASRVVIYIAAFYFLAAALFRRRELEF